MLFTVLFFISIFIIAAVSFSSSIRSERDTALREENMLAASVQQEILKIEADPDSPSNAVSYEAASEGEYFQKKGVYISLAQGSDIKYRDLPVIAVSTASLDTRLCEILSANGSHYICVYDTLYSAKSQSYSFIYMKDISGVYSSINGEAYLLAGMGVFVSVLFAFGLYFTLKRINKPVDNLAHELRTPLTAIRGYAEYLAASAITEEDRFTATKYIIDESRRLSDICNKLLILANLREGDISFEKADMKAIFENAKMTYKNVEYEVKKHSIKGDKTLLQSMINNLVSNAVNASPEGTPVKLIAYDNIIEISDSGAGMGKETLSNISKPNYRPAAGRERQGNGLGIPLCHQIARLHNAHVSFISEEGKGTIVRITFTSS